MVLGDIFSDSVGIAIWQRQPQLLVETYFDTAFAALGLGVNGVYSVATMRDELARDLPDGPNKQEAIADIFLLSDMLTCLFDCEQVGLRVVPLKKAMCPRFHVDNIPVRLVNTYLGEGSDWLPLEVLQNSPNGVKGESLNRKTLGQYNTEEHVQQLNRFDVGLLKGKAWPGHEHLAAIHRSCPVAADAKRVLLTLDPM